MKLKNSLFTSLLVIGLVAGTVGTVSADTLRFASESPRTDTQSIAGQRFNELLKAKTNGALDIKIFADSSLGAFQAAIAGVRGGTIDMAVSGSANFGGMVPLLGIFDIPFMFKDTAHAYRVLDGKVGQDMLDKLGEFGMKGLAFWDNGWREMTNNLRPINTPADVKGIKIRTTGSPAHIEAFKLLGANPLPMPLAELYTALEMKTVDAQEHPLGVLWSAKLYEVQKHLSLTNHAYSALIVVMNKAKFDALPPAQQKALVEAAREAGQYQRKLNNEGMAKIVADLKKAGMQVVENVDGGPFLEATKPGRETFIAKFGGTDVIKAIDAARDAK
ncbi:MAG: TRAP transporter substrate-binding protein [Rhodoferax sp.]|uniref:TRAP transporter substrate-binding protein n=1 Tax=Rhodoferax sp. TaxID=50421 RepID=UPI002736A1A1|nr:TRAP transporter substrate-binding protein [Rhodoferax sp.]MDP2680931.1 TRAP transporter substrate-binding protein [Rhodoferax sp.]